MLAGLVFETKILCRASVFLARVNNAPAAGGNILSHDPNIAANLYEVKPDSAGLTDFAVKFRVNLKGWFANGSNWG
ncbi:hypothetical protein [Rhodomicrobium vannielii]|uniref:hypothetical protein n=1 Tax=Rhodomicrobium vannielii TaxID=1069 RepID=UPI0002EAEC1D|nr:hypothetical protein [Rhodomicrobium vannielii]